MMHSYIKKSGESLSLIGLLCTMPELGFHFTASDGEGRGKVLMILYLSEIRLYCWRQIKAITSALLFRKYNYMLSTLISACVLVTKV